MFGCPKFKQSASHCLGPHWCPTAPCPSGARFPVAGGAHPGLWHRRKAGWGPGLGKLPCASGTKSHCHFQFPTAWPECSTPETGSGNDSVALTTPQACKGGVTLLGWGLSPTHVFPGTHAGPPPEQCRPSDLPRLFSRRAVGARLRPQGAGSLTFIRNAAVPLVRAFA